jgi:hypothetical protein
MSKNSGKSKLSKNVLFNAINMFFIVKIHWKPYFTDDPRRKKLLYIKLPGGTEENDEKPQSGYLVSRQKTEAKNF